MAIFRVEKTRDFTVMSNHHLKNRILSLKAKGLLSLILSLPDDWDYTMKGLASINVEGIDAIRQAITELETQGYVVRERVRDGKGCLRGTEYVIYEQPHLQAALPGYQEDAQHIASQPTPANPALGKPILENPILDNPTLENPVQGKPALENPMQLNTNGSNTHPIHKTTAANPYPINRPGCLDDGGIGWDRDGYAAAESYRDAVRKRIEYEVLAQDAQCSGGRLDEIVDIMVETMCATNPSMSIAGNHYPTALVQERLRQISSRHIRYVFECLNKNTSQVHNIKKYLLAVLFNAPATMDGYYAALINQNFGSIVPDAFDCDLDELPDEVDTASNLTL